MTNQNCCSTFLEGGQVQTLSFPVQPLSALLRQFEASFIVYQLNHVFHLKITHDVQLSKYYKDLTGNAFSNVTRVAPQNVFCQSEAKAAAIFIETKR